jgi:hypothetical protein
MRDCEYYAIKKKFINQVFGLKISKFQLSVREEIVKPKIDYKSFSVDNSKALVVYKNINTIEKKPNIHRKLKKLKVFIVCCFCS